MYYIILFIENNVMSEYHSVSNIRFDEDNDLLFDCNGKTHLYKQTAFDSLVIRKEVFND